MEANAWRNTSKTVRFFFFDGRAMFFLLIALYYISLWTLGVCIVGITILTWFEKKGYTLPNAWRKMKVWIAGNKRPAVMPRRLGRSDR